MLELDDDFCGPESCVFEHPEKTEAEGHNIARFPIVSNEDDTIFTILQDALELYGHSGHLGEKFVGRFQKGEVRLLALGISDRRTVWWMCTDEVYRVFIEKGK